MDTKQDIRKLSPSELEELVIKIGEPKFRAKQIYQWIWQKNALSFDEMSNLSKSLREKLSLEFDFFPVKILKTQISEDRTIKFAFQLFDGKICEGVLIPTEKRMTACISSQVGCSLSCTFCATGYLKMQRNIDYAEIVDQVRIIDEKAQEMYGQALTNIVYMGMGEPLLNYKNVKESIHRITKENGWNWAQRRITLSTSGIAKMIRAMADDELKVNLALSLHNANNTKRSIIMPISESNTLSDLKDALIYIYQKLNTSITLEYCVIKGENDSPEDLDNLVKYAKSIPCKINLIEYNPIKKSEHKNAGIKAMEIFSGKLRAKKLDVFIRRSRGKDIDAGCGQLANLLVE